MAEGNKDNDAIADLKARLKAAEKRAKELEGENRDLQGRNAALEQELRPFHVLADNISDHIYFKDKQGRFIWVNRNLYSLRGRRRPAPSLYARSPRGMAQAAER